jgi:hypothetical protein
MKKNGFSVVISDCIASQLVFRNGFCCSDEIKCVDLFVFPLQE